MAAVTFGLIFNNIHLMLHGGHIVSFHTIAGFEMFACILSVIVTIYLRIKNKNLHSPLITMELQGWQIDSVISLGMAFAFLLPLMIPFAWFDRVTPEEETIEDIKKTVEPIIGIYGHKNLYYDIVRTGRKLWISVYITFDKDIVSLSKFKHLQDKCIKALAQKYPDFYFELLPDIEFTGIEEE